LVKEISQSLIATGNNHTSHIEDDCSNFSGSFDRVKSYKEN